LVFRRQFYKNIYRVKIIINSLPGTALKCTKVRKTLFVINSAVLMEMGRHYSSKIKIAI
jgi:hypothetical protein